MKLNSSYKNRGMQLEKAINETNLYYEEKDIAYIYKKPTPIKVLNVIYPKSKGHLIDKAVYEKISTLDYNGIYKEKYIEFDAKECMSKTAFPLSNIQIHQLKHMKNIINHGGIIFLIIFINNKYFLLKAEDILSFIDKNQRKSIPLEYIEENGYKIKEGFIPRLNYLEVIDKIYINNEKKRDDLKV